METNPVGRRCEVVFEVIQDVSETLALQSPTKPPLTRRSEADEGGSRSKNECSTMTSALQTFDVLRAPPVHFDWSADSNAADGNAKRSLSIAPGASSTAGGELTQRPRGSAMNVAPYSRDRNDVSQRTAIIDNFVRRRALDDVTQRRSGWIAVTRKHTTPVAVVDNTATASTVEGGSDSQNKWTSSFSPAPTPLEGKASIAARLSREYRLVAFSPLPTTNSAAEGTAAAMAQNTSSDNALVAIPALSSTPIAVEEVNDDGNTDASLVESISLTRVKRAEAAARLRADDGREDAPRRPRTVVFTEDEVEPQKMGDGETSEEPEARTPQERPSTPPPPQEVHLSHRSLLNFASLGKPRKWTSHRFDRAVERLREVTNAQFELFYGNEMEGAKTLATIEALPRLLLETVAAEEGDSEESTAAAVFGEDPAARQKRAEEGSKRRSELMHARRTLLSALVPSYPLPALADEGQSGDATRSSGKKTFARSKRGEQNKFGSAQIDVDPITAPLSIDELKSEFLESMLANSVELKMPTQTKTEVSSITAPNTADSASPAQVDPVEASPSTDVVNSPTSKKAATKSTAAKNNGGKQGKGGTTTSAKAKVVGSNPTSEEAPSQAAIQGKSGETAESYQSTIAVPPVAVTPKSDVFALLVGHLVTCQREMERMEIRKRMDSALLAKLGNGKKGGEESATADEPLPFSSSIPLDHIVNTLNVESIMDSIIAHCNMELSAAAENKQKTVGADGLASESGGAAKPLAKPKATRIIHKPGEAVESSSKTTGKNGTKSKKRKDKLKGIGTPAAGDGEDEDDHLDASDYDVFSSSSGSDDENGTAGGEGENGQQKGGPTFVASNAGKRRKDSEFLMLGSSEGFSKSDVKRLRDRFQLISTMSKGESLSALEAGAVVRAVALRRGNDAVSFSSPSKRGIGFNSPAAASSLGVAGNNGLSGVFRTSSFASEKQPSSSNHVNSVFRPSGAFASNPQTPREALMATTAASVSPNAAALVSRTNSLATVGFGGTMASSAVSPSAGALGGGGGGARRQSLAQPLPPFDESLAFDEKTVIDASRYPPTEEDDAHKKRLSTSRAAAEMAVDLSAGDAPSIRRSESIAGGLSIAVGVIVGEKKLARERQSIFGNPLDTKAIVAAGRAAGGSNENSLLLTSRLATSPSSAEASVISASSATNHPPNPNFPRYHVGVAPLAPNWWLSRAYDPTALLPYKGRGVAVLGANDESEEAMLAFNDVELPQNTFNVNNNSNAMSSSFARTLSGTAAAPAQPFFQEHVPPTMPSKHYADALQWLEDAASAASLSVNKQLPSTLRAAADAEAEGRVASFTKKSSSEGGPSAKANTDAVTVFKAKSSLDIIALRRRAAIILKHQLFGALLTSDGFNIVPNKKNTKPQSSGRDAGENTNTQRLDKTSSAMALLLHWLDDYESRRAIEKGQSSSAAESDTASPVPATGKGKTADKSSATSTAPPRPTASDFCYVFLDARDAATKALNERCQDERRQAAAAREARGGKKEIQSSTAVATIADSSDKNKTTSESTNPTLSNMGFVPTFRFEKSRSGSRSDSYLSIVDDGDEDDAGEGGKVDEEDVKDPLATTSKYYEMMKSGSRSSTLNGGGGSASASSSAKSLTLAGKKISNAANNSTADPQSATDVPTAPAAAAATAPAASQDFKAEFITDAVVDTDVDEDTVTTADDPLGRRPVKVVADEDAVSAMLSANKAALSARHERVVGMIEARRIAALEALDANYQQLKAEAVPSDPDFEGLNDDGAHDDDVSAVKGGAEEKKSDYASDEGASVRREEAYHAARAEIEASFQRKIQSANNHFMLKNLLESQFVPVLENGVEYHIRDPNVNASTTPTADTLSPPTSNEAAKSKSQKTPKALSSSEIAAVVGDPNITVIERIVFKDEEERFKAALLNLRHTADAAAKAEAEREALRTRQEEARWVQLVSQFVKQLEAEEAKARIAVELLERDDRFGPLEAGHSQAVRAIQHTAEKERIWELVFAGEKEEAAVRRTILLAEEAAFAAILRRELQMREKTMTLIQHVIVFPAFDLFAPGPPLAEQKKRYQETVDAIALEHKQAVIAAVKSGGRIQQPPPPTIPPFVAIPSISFVQPTNLNILFAAPSTILESYDDAKNGLIDDTDAKAHRSFMAKDYAEDPDGYLEQYFSEYSRYRPPSVFLHSFMCQGMLDVPNRYRIREGDGRQGDGGSQSTLFATIGGESSRPFVAGEGGSRRGSSQQQSVANEGMTKEEIEAQKAMAIMTELEEAKYKEALRRGSGGEMSPMLRESITAWAGRGDLVGIESLGGRDKSRNFSVASRVSKRPSLSQNGEEDEAARRQRQMLLLEETSAEEELFLTDEEALGLVLAAPTPPQSPRLTAADDEEDAFPTIRLLVDTSTMSKANSTTNSSSQRKAAPPMHPLTALLAQELAKKHKRDAKEKKRAERERVLRELSGGGTAKLPSASSSPTTAPPNVLPSQSGGDSATAASSDKANDQKSVEQKAASSASSSLSVNKPPPKKDALSELLGRKGHSEGSVTDEKADRKPIESRIVSGQASRTPSSLREKGENSNDEVNEEADDHTAGVLQSDRVVDITSTNANGKDDVPPGQGLLLKTQPTDMDAEASDEDEDGSGGRRGKRSVIIDKAAELKALGGGLARTANMAEKLKRKESVAAKRARLERERLMAEAQAAAEEEAARLAAEQEPQAADPSLLAGANGGEAFFETARVTEEEKALREKKARLEQYQQKMNERKARQSAGLRAGSASGTYDSSIYSGSGSLPPTAAPTPRLFSSDSSRPLSPADHLSNNTTTRRGMGEVGQCIGAADNDVPSSARSAFTGLNGRIAPPPHLAFVTMPNTNKADLLPPLPPSKNSKLIDGLARASYSAAAGSSGGDAKKKKRGSSAPQHDFTLCYDDASVSEKRRNNATDHGEEEDGDAARIREEAERKEAARLKEEAQRDAETRAEFEGILGALGELRHLTGRDDDDDDDDDAEFDDEDDLSSVGAFGNGSDRDDDFSLSGGSDVDDAEAQHRREAAKNQGVFVGLGADDAADDLVRVGADGKTLPPLTDERKALRQQERARIARKKALRSDGDGNARAPSSSQRGRGGHKALKSKKVRERTASMERAIREHYERITADAIAEAFPSREHMLHAWRFRPFGATVVTLMKPTRHVLQKLIDKGGIRLGGATDTEKRRKRKAMNTNTAGDEKKNKKKQEASLWWQIAVAKGEQAFSASEHNNATTPLPLDFATSVGRVRLLYSDDEDDAENARRMPVFDVSQIVRVRPKPIRTDKDGEDGGEDTNDGVRAALDAALLAGASPAARAVASHNSPSAANANSDGENEARKARFDSAGNRDDRSTTRITRSRLMPMFPTASGGFSSSSPRGIDRVQHVTSADHLDWLRGGGGGGVSSGSPPSAAKTKKGAGIGLMRPSGVSTMGGGGAGSRATSISGASGVSVLSSRRLSVQSAANAQQSPTRRHNNNNMSKHNGGVMDSAALYKALGVLEANRRSSSTQHYMHNGGNSFLTAEEEEGGGGIGLAVVGSAAPIYASVARERRDKARSIVSRQHEPQQYKGGFTYASTYAQQQQQHAYSWPPPRIVTSDAHSLFETDFAVRPMTKEERRRHEAITRDHTNNNTSNSPSGQKLATPSPPLPPSTIPYTEETVLRDAPFFPHFLPRSRPVTTSTSATSTSALFRLQEALRKEKEIKAAFLSSHSASLFSNRNGDDNDASDGAKDNDEDDDALQAKKAALAASAANGDGVPTSHLTPMEEIGESRRNPRSFLSKGTLHGRDDLTRAMGTTITPGRAQSTASKRQYVGRAANALLPPISPSMVASGVKKQNAVLAKQRQELLAAIEAKNDAFYNNNNTSTLKNSSRAQSPMIANVSTRLPLRLATTTPTPHRLRPLDGSSAATPLRPPTSSSSAAASSSTPLHLPLSSKYVPSIITVKSLPTPDSKRRPNSNNSQTKTALVGSLKKRLVPTDDDDGENDMPTMNPEGSFVFGSSESAFGAAPDVGEGKMNFCSRRGRSAGTPMVGKRTRSSTANSFRSVGGESTATANTEGLLKPCTQAAIRSAVNASTYLAPAQFALRHSIDRVADVQRDLVKLLEGLKWDMMR